RGPRLWGDDTLRPPAGPGRDPRRPRDQGRGLRSRGLERLFDRPAPALRGAGQRPADRPAEVPALASSAWDEWLDGLSRLDHLADQDRALAHQLQELLLDLHQVLARPAQSAEPVP